MERYSLHDWTIGFSIHDLRYIYSMLRFPSFFSLFHFKVSTSITLYLYLEGIPSLMITLASYITSFVNSIINYNVYSSFFISIQLEREFCLQLSFAPHFVVCTLFITSDLKMKVVLINTINIEYIYIIYSQIYKIILL